MLLGLSSFSGFFLSWGQHSIIFLWLQRVCKKALTDTLCWVQVSAATLPVAIIAFFLILFRIGTILWVTVNITVPVMRMAMASPRKILVELLLLDTLCWVQVSAATLPVAIIAFFLILFRIGTILWVTVNITVPVMRMAMASPRKILVELLLLVV